MLEMTDEGYMEEGQLVDGLGFGLGSRSVRECEELAYKLLASLPRNRLATIQRRLAPLLQFDVVGSLPLEISLHIFSLLPYQTLLLCGLVSKRWNALGNDSSLWRALCQERSWRWREQRGVPQKSTQHHHQRHRVEEDEGMGDSDEEEDLDDSGFVSFTQQEGPSTRMSVYPDPPPATRQISRDRHSAPSILMRDHVASLKEASTTYFAPDYKLLYRTHTRLHQRFLSGSQGCCLSALQTHGAPTNAHTATIYCLQLYTYKATGKQVLFTGSRDRSVREWNLESGLVERVLDGVHGGSVLSLCVGDIGGRVVVATAGSDRIVGIASTGAPKIIQDHEDSVLCVRFDSKRLVSCSKDRTIRTYLFPHLRPEHVLTKHRAAVNAVSLSGNWIISGSGDRSVKMWDAESGELVRTFDNHHTRGIASIDFMFPHILSGSSDKHLRLFDVTSQQGWSTALSTQHVPAAGMICHSCGSSNVHYQGGGGDAGCMHADLVRSVALGDEFVVSGSYDLSIKIWSLATGALVANLAGGHTGRIFCIGFDSTKVVSCGEDQRICIWDFAHGIDTSFMEL